MSDHLTNIANHLLQRFPEEVEVQAFEHHLLVKFEDRQQFIVKRVWKFDDAAENIS